ncbi:NUDIX domain-containing protein [Sphingomonas sp.]|uniref:NUDIX domain-containing protein n=1 Tax=Sphingomonas sp. TaxID=28214 RepID=UPI0025E5B1EA|nr:NUDIX domain-containing protein [Sphingomonas sp.]
MLVDKALRLLLRAAHSLLKLSWFVRRPNSFGVHALALTPQGRAILVKLRYAPGWRLPGGGRKETENPRDAVLRELREEIGMTSHGSLDLACELEEEVDHKKDWASLFIVRDVQYRPKWSWEVEEVMEADLDSLPSDLSSRMAGWLGALRPKL